MGELAMFFGGFLKWNRQSRIFSLSFLFSFSLSSFPPPLRQVPPPFSVPGRFIMFAGILANQTRGFVPFRVFNLSFFTQALWTFDSAPKYFLPTLDSKSGLPPQKKSQKSKSNTQNSFRLRRSSDSLPAKPSWSIAQNCKSSPRFGENDIKTSIVAKYHPQQVRPQCVVYVKDKHGSAPSLAPRKRSLKNTQLFFHNSLDVFFGSVVDFYIDYYRISGEYHYCYSFRYIISTHNLAQYFTSADGFRKLSLLC